MGNPKRVDLTQREIVETLRAHGMQVTSLATVGFGVPDLLVSYRDQWHLIEVKNGKLGWKLTPAQKKFRALANAPISILTSVDDALLWVARLNGKPEHLIHVERKRA